MSKTEFDVLASMYGFELPPLNPQYTEDPLLLTPDQISAPHAHRTSAPFGGPPLPGFPASPVALHEAVHITTGVRLGLVAVCGVIGAHGGETLFAHGGTPDELHRTAIAIAAAILFDRKAQVDPAMHEDDLERVSELCRRYRDAAGYDCPDPFSSAEPFFRDVTFTADVFAVAARLDAAGHISQSEIESLVAAPPAPEYEYAI